MTLAIALVASTSNGGTVSGVTSSAINSTGATLLTAMVAYYGTTGTTANISDSSGNTWTQLSDYTNGTNYRVRLFYCLAPTSAASHTMTFSKSGSYPTVCFSAWSGVSTYDSESGSSANGTSVKPGSITPTSSGALLLTSLFNGAVQSYAIDSGFTELANVAFLSGQHVGGEFAYLIQPTAAAVNPTWSWSTTTTVVVNMACFLPSASSGFSAAWATRQHAVIGGGMI